MDPVSVLQVAGFAASAAKGAVEISKDLYILYKEARNIDQTIQGLAAEVQGLGNACALVDERLRGIVDEHDNALACGGPAKARLWSCVELQVRDSRKTIDQLRLAFQNVHGQGGGVWSQVWRQIKLNTRTRDIAEARNRLRSHTASLQMVLQTIAIELSSNGDQQLQTLLAKAEECVGHLKALRAESIEEDAEQRAREEEILALGEQTVSIAQESLYGASIANGSIMGDPANKSSHVHGWLQDVTAIERTMPALDTINESDLHSAMSDEPSTIFTDDFRRISTAPTSVVAPSEHYKEMVNARSVYGDAEDESEEYELLVDAAKDALNTAEACFQATDYKEASEELQEALKIILELPSHQQSKVCNTWEIRYLLSVCAYHTESLEDAKAQLRTVVDYALRASLQTNAQRKQCCEAGHLLSIVCVKLGHLEEGRQYCQSAYDARKKLNGKSHPETYQSLALLARVWHLSGNPRRGNIFSRLIPENERQSYLGAIDDLIKFSPDVPAFTKPADGQMLQQMMKAPAETEPVSTPDPKNLIPGTTRPPIDTTDSHDSGVSMTFDRTTEPNATSTKVSRNIAMPDSLYEPFRTLTDRTLPTMRGDELQITTYQDGKQSASQVPTSTQLDSAQNWKLEATNAMFNRLDIDDSNRARGTGTPCRLVAENTAAVTISPQVPHQPRRVSTAILSEAASERPTAQSEPFRSVPLARRAPSFDDRASLASSRIDADEQLLSQIENPAERREIAALLPQMRTIAETVAHIRMQAQFLEQTYYRALPRDCIVETNIAERSLALARKYAYSSLRPSTRPEVQNAERSIRKATESLERYASNPEAVDASMPVPALTKKSTFSKLKGFGNNDKTPQDILIETSCGDIKVRTLDDSKSCKQFTSRVQNGSYTNKELQVTSHGLKVLNGDHSFLLTPAPTRVLDEKLALVGYVVQGFELIAQTVDARGATPVNIIDCRLISTVDTASRGQVETTASSSGSRKRRGMGWSISDGIVAGMNGS